MGLLEFLAQGGPLMIFIGICSIMTFAITIERFIRLRDHSVIPEGFKEQLIELLKSHRLAGAREFCDKHKEIGVKIFQAGLTKAGAPREVIREYFESAGKEVSQDLSRGLGILSTIASISPLIGLLGTVTGMIQVFRIVSVQGIGNPSALSGGIAQALIATAGGLTVGIPSLMLYNFFIKKTERIVIKLERITIEILDLVDQSGSMDDGLEI
jgi:biopolymer transport protein ExbB